MRQSATQTSRARADGESYGDNLKEAQALTQAGQSQHPYMTRGAMVTGAVAGTTAFGRSLIDDIAARTTLSA
ncbi:hypothetical protein [Sinorhizobium fredii]|uniref:Uncharacterized protein n=1 Tax=Rhizobium fredii TaxID=380 RepID=A0A2A6M7A7_RHIFR|nr:hypothetical protein [Sinorhizobium fredii]PDT50427.1 hypothetical protein CO661_02010 [Sinorhizobium fredii]